MDMDTSRTKNKTCQRAEELLVSQGPSTSGVQLSDILLQLGYCFLGGFWQDLHSGHCETLHSAKPLNTKKTENQLRGSTSCAAALCRAAHQMMGLGQTLWDPIP